MAKRANYAELARQLEEIAARMEAERQRITTSFAEAFATNEIVLKLSPLSRNELETVAAALADRVDDILAELDQQAVPGEEGSTDRQGEGTVV